MIVIGLDLLLAALLLAAVMMGWRLNGRLGALRASQLDFAKAVMELDAAAARAETGLTALRSAAEEAHDSLLARIDTARALATRLEKAEASAEGAARRAEAAAAEAKAAPPPPSPLRPLRDALSRDIGSRDPGARDHASRPEGVPAEPTKAAPRRRPIADEALFADAEEGAVRPGLQGLLRMSLARR
jgi:Domain of unknown function (DUF6468)